MNTPQLLCPSPLLLFALVLLVAQFNPAYSGESVAQEQVAANGVSFRLGTIAPAVASVISDFGGVIEFRGIISNSYEFVIGYQRSEHDYEQPDVPNVDAHEFYFEPRHRAGLLSETHVSVGPRIGLYRLNYNDRYNRSVSYFTLGFTGAAVRMFAENAGLEVTVGMSVVRTEGSFDFGHRATVGLFIIMSRES